LPLLVSLARTVSPVLSWLIGTVLPLASRTRVPAVNNSPPQERAEGSWPLVRGPVAALRHPEFAPWCGTVLTGEWHTRYQVGAVVYGHLHIPRTTRYDGIRFEEVSVGYPREWQRRGVGPPPPRVILGNG
jgi:hypothetical protein